MTQLARISRGVRAALRTSSTNHGLPNDWLKKSNPWKVVSPSYFNPNGITNPRPPFLLSSFTYATSTDKDGVTSEGKGKDDEPHNRLIDELATSTDKDGVTSEGKGKDDEPHNRLIDELELLSKILSVLKLFGLVFKHGNPFGESVNLNNYNGYDELIARLDKVFKFNGELISSTSEFSDENLIVVYLDDEGYMTRLRRDAFWPRFCDKVRKIFIYTRDEFEE